MVTIQILHAGALVGAGIVVAIILIFFGFWLGRKTQGESLLPPMFEGEAKMPEMDVFERAQLPPEEGGYTDEELADMARARPYEGIQ